MSLFKKDESYVGVDIGADGMKLVQLHKVKGRAQFGAYGIAEAALDIHVDSPTITTPDGVLEEKRGSAQKKSVFSPAEEARVDQYAALLKSLLERSRVTTRRAIASLPVSQVFHAIVTLPVVEEKELEYHVRAKVKKLLPRPIEEMQVLHQLIPQPSSSGTKKDLKVLVTAAPIHMVDFYSAIFSRSGLQLEELETEAFALERSLVGHDPSTVMVVDIGGERTNFFIMDQGLPVTYRTIHIGGSSFDAILSSVLGVTPEQARQLKRDTQYIRDGIDWRTILMSAVEPIIKEIQYSFDLFLHQSGNEAKRPEKIILTGGASLFYPLGQILTESFPMKVFVGDPWARAVYQQDLKEVLDTIGARMSVAIGLAMRHIVA